MNGSSIIIAPAVGMEAWREEDQGNLSSHPQTLYPSSIALVKAKFLFPFLARSQFEIMMGKG